MYYQYIIIFAILVLISIVVIKINKKDFSVRINKLIQALGGEDNIVKVEINMSRLKVIVKDTSIVDKDTIQKLGAKGIVEIDNQLKIILGPNSKQLKKYMKDLKQN